MALSSSMTMIQTTLNCSSNSSTQMSTTRKPSLSLRLRTRPNASRFRSECILLLTSMLSRDYADQWLATFSLHSKLRNSTTSRHW